MATRHLSPRGFTLLEVLTAVAVAGIIGSLAVVATADTIVDARAKAEARVVVERLREEHRAAREQRVGLKVTAEQRSVTYQHTKGPGCTLPVGDARVVTYDAASLVLSSPTGACFNLRGEMDTGSSTGVIINQNSTSTSGGGGTTLSTPTITVTARMSGETAWVLPLRIDPAGIADLPAQRVADTANLDVVIDGARNFTDPVKSMTFTPPETNLQGGATEPAPIEPIEDPCMKFDPEQPLIDCTHVLTN